MNYGIGVLNPKHIKFIALAILVFGSFASQTRAADLTSEEKLVCPTLQVCTDIIRRHDASEFDYDVLETQFRKFGKKGRAALFDLLMTKSGNADIATILANAGPLTLIERKKLGKTWTLARAGTYLPLMQDGHIYSRDLLLLTLGSDQADVREQARLALIQIPGAVKRQGVPQSLAKPLLAALSRDPFAEAAPYLSRLNSEGHLEAFAGLLGSADANIVSASYHALFNRSPETAFKALLAEMGEINTSAQSRAIGEMLVRRNLDRSDGFYLKFARDMSGDKTQSVPARASALHAVLIAKTGRLPEFTPERIEALKFLVQNQPVITQDQYLPCLKKEKAESALNLIWAIAKTEKWVNRDRISLAFSETDQYSRIIGDLLDSDDVRSVSFGLTQAKPVHASIIRKKINHPIKRIDVLARKSLKLPAASKSGRPCIISSFDSDDRLKQMPFFDFAWMKTKTSARVLLDRKYLTTAHATKTGWLAGYNLGQLGSAEKSNHSAGTLVHYDNKSGGFKRIGDFNGPVAILPNRSLKLGEVTNRFWVVDSWGGNSGGLSAYAVNLSDRNSKVTHLGALPDHAEGFTVAPNGDLLMRVEDGVQPPLRMSPRGKISLACRPAKPAIPAPAPI